METHDRCCRKLTMSIRFEPNIWEIVGEERLLEQRDFIDPGDSKQSQSSNSINVIINDFNPLTWSSLS